ncbi:hypothetical protein [Leucobacter sp. HY1910]
MNSLSHTDDGRDIRFELPSLNAGDVSVSSGYLTGGGEPDSPVIVLDVPERDAALSLEQALSVMAALQSSVVRLMEEQGRQITRRTEPGAPSFEETI